MIARLFKNEIFRFLFSILLFYIAWFLLYTIWLHPNEKLDLYIISITVSACKWILELFGYSVYTGADRLIGIDGTSGLWIGDGCNGILLFAIFTGFIVAFPGNWKKKILFITIGILLLQILNIIRIVALAIIDTHSRAWTEFNHTYTFNIIMYGFIFFLWMLWVTKISDGKLHK